MSDAPPEQTPQEAVFDARAVVRALPTRPGVYRMLNADGQVIYVGKASSLRKRVGSYFGRRPTTPKVAAMVALVRDIEVTVTRSEGEALILENTLIKQLQPRYNVNLRDDKSYPYIYLQGDHDFPRLGFHRGAKGRKGRYFGPYPSAGAVRSSLHLLQRLFPVQKVRAMYFTGEPIDAAEAYRLGAIEAVVGPEQLRDKAMAIAGGIAGKSAAMLRLAKESLNGIEDGNLEDKYRWEQGFTLQAYMEPDSAETRRAFVEKRDADVNARADNN